MEPQLIPSFLYSLVRLQRRLGWTRAELDAHRAAELRKFRAHAMARSKFYREFHRGLERAPLAALPVLTRTTLLDRFDDLVTDPRIRLADVQRHLAGSPLDDRYLGRYGVTTSTGSGGGGVTLVLTDGREWVFDLASTARARDLAGLRWTPLRPDRTAFVVSSHRWFSMARAVRTLQSRFAPQLLLDVNTPWRELVRRLNAYRPTILSGYGSTMAMLAEEQLAGRLHISPRLVNTGGEVTLPEARRRIRDAWGDEPFDYYGTAEAGTVAAECREGRRMHLFEDTTIIEVVDERDAPVPPGTWGAKVLVTPLWLRTQPLIRFELNDVVAVAPEPCVCGRATRVLEGIRGRTPRVFQVPAVAGGTVPVSWMGLATGVVELPVVWRSFDLQPDAFVVRVVGLPAGYDLEPLRARIQAEFAAHGAVPLPVRIEVLAEIPRGPGGKAAVGAPPASSSSTSRVAG